MTCSTSHGVCPLRTASPDGPGGQQARVASSYFRVPPERRAALAQWCKEHGLGLVTRVGRSGRREPDEGFAIIGDAPLESDWQGRIDDGELAAIMAEGESVIIVSTYWEAFHASIAAQGFLVVAGGGDLPAASVSIEGALRLEAERLGVEPGPMLYDVSPFLQ